MPPKRMTANPVRPARYRPGKPLGELHESSEEEEEEEELEGVDDKAPKPPKESTAIVSSALKKVDLNKRFEQARKVEQARQSAEESSEESDEVAGQTETDESGEDSSEYVSDSSESEAEVSKSILLRPMFIHKSKRNGSAVIEESAASLGAESGKRKIEEIERRKEEAQALVEEHLRQQAEAREASRRTTEDDHANDASLIDDTDDIDPAAERAAWKLRELLRVKRERDELEKVEREREEIERRRNMDERERYKEDMEYVRKQRDEAKEARGQMAFMQKYYHKGAFYRDDSEILKRDYATAPVEDQTVNKEILPKYMQVRGEEYGKRGKTKWTHLAAEDTSKAGGGSPWFDKRFTGTRPGKLGGMRDERFISKGIRGDERDGRSENDRRDYGSKLLTKDGQRDLFSKDRDRAAGRLETDKPRHRPRSRSRSQERNRHKDRGQDRYYPRDGDRYRDYQREYAPKRLCNGESYMDRERSRSRGRGADRKRPQIDKGESIDKRRRVGVP